MVLVGWVKITFYVLEFNRVECAVAFGGWFLTKFMPSNLARNSPIIENTVQN
jgi:uncharacterized protein YneF (UPF0154 family)